MITQSQNASIVVDIPAWLSRTTLDAIGKGRAIVVTTIQSDFFSFFFFFIPAVFDYDFGALDDGDNELSAAYDNLL